MEQSKNVLKNTTDTNDVEEGVKDDGKQADEVAHDYNSPEPIEINQEVKEQELFKEATSTALELQTNAVLNSPEIIAFEKMRVFAREVIKSSVSPFKREADVIVVLQRGAELGLPYGVSVNNIFPIGGKTGMSVHLHKAMLENAGVYFELREDNVPIYYYGLANDKNQFTPYGKTAERKLEGFVVHPTQVDTRTTYYFERNTRDKITGEVRKKKVTMSYYYSEAVAADLVKKDVWVKYQRALMKARCFTMGATEIASDVVQGMLGINELAMEFGKSFTIDENLVETFTDIVHEDVND